MGVDLVVEGLSEKSQQGDRKIVDILALPPSNLTIDTKDIPDLVPILAVYLSLCVNGTSKIINAARVRIKESDRLLAISQELNKLGAKITLLPDGLVIEHVDHLIGGTVDSWNDHRIAMSLAIASLKANGKVIITKPECVNKSYPDF
jgi:3-phosphoshikimate 1-carboxyvinyltransferase